jgi:DNA-binding transcriptional regulator YbjK
MPRPNPSRREHLADAAIEVLARRGARGLTHRAVDAVAGAPEGTTSRYFRTREALLGAVVDRSLASLAGTLQPLGQVVRTTGPHALADAMARAVREAVTDKRSRSAAMCELLLEARRRDLLGRRLTQARVELMELLRQIALASELKLSDRQAVQLLSFATGTVVTALTVPSPPGELFGQPVETLVRSAVTAILEAGDGRERRGP